MDLIAPERGTDGSAASQPVGQVSMEQLAALVREAVRGEFAKQGPGSTLRLHAKQSSVL